MNGRRSIAMLMCVGALAGCSSPSGTGVNDYVPGDGVPVEVPAEERTSPVELSGRDLEHNEVNIAEWRGRPVVVNVWWSQCGPCLTEQPELNEVHDQLADAVRFVGLNIRDASSAEGLAFTRRFDVAYPSIYSPDGQALLAFTGVLNPRSIPSTVVLDERGRVAAVVQGSIPTAQTLVDLVHGASQDSAERTRASVP